MSCLGAFPLKDYLDIRKYDEVCRKRFSRTYDLRKVVEKVGRLREPGRPLQAVHVVELFNPEEIHFGHFWKPPRDLEETLNPRRISLAMPRVPDDGWRLGMVAAVFECFGSIEAASVLLRSVHPNEFGVYSPPLINLLQLPACPPAEHYLSYCDELRAWGTHFGTGGVADTDQALWLFYEWAYGPACMKMESVDDGRDAKTRRDQFENDRWVRERQVTSVLRPFFHTWSALDQAGCLADVDANLAGKIAGCELEKRLRNSTGLEEDVPSLILAFSLQGDCAAARKNEIKQRLRRAWKLRNRTMHTEHALDAADVHSMIDAIRELLPG